MFKAIGREDRTALCALANTFIGKGKDTAALLCLDHVFSSPLDLRNLPLARVQTWLSLYLDYVRLLNQFMRDGSLVPGSDRQKLFGFQVLGEGRCLIPKLTLLHEKLANRTGSSGSSADGYRCGFAELRRSIAQLIRSRIDERTEIQNGACRDIHGFAPCLQLLVQRNCIVPKGNPPCTLQHIQPDQFTLEWYHARLRLILLQFIILDSARCYGFRVAKYVLAYSVPTSCGCSLNVKLLACDAALSISSTFSEARIARKF